ncbi:MAG: hypothetical protein HQM14_15080 [SAR324 cluster bacterium]|nr:hypothetical protein [SAR324 cluster bacterium]
MIQDIFNPLIATTGKGFGILLLYSIGLICLFYSNKSYRLLPIIIWLTGALFIEGLFGIPPWGRFQGAFSTIGIWILSISLFHLMLSKSLHSIMIGLGNEFPQWKLLHYFTLPRVATTVWLVLVIFWVVRVKALIPPAGVFTTHTDIRMGRYIENNLPTDALIVTMWPPDHPRHTGSLFMTRGNSARNTVFSRIADHQVKYGHLKSKGPFGACLNKEPHQILRCLQNTEATHLFVEATHKTENFIKLFKATPIKHFGQTYLFAVH